MFSTSRTTFSTSRTIFLTSKISYPTWKPRVRRHKQHFLREILTTLKNNISQNRKKNLFFNARNQSFFPGGASPPQTPPIGGAPAPPNPPGALGAAAPRPPHGKKRDGGRPGTAVGPSDGRPTAVRRPSDDRPTTVLAILFSHHLGDVVNGASLYLAPQIPGSSSFFLRPFSFRFFIDFS